MAREEIEKSEVQEAKMTFLRNNGRIVYLREKNSNTPVGTTLLAPTVLDKEFCMSVALCHPNDNFSKCEGFKTALARMVGGDTFILSANYVSSVWSGLMFKLTLQNRFGRAPALFNFDAFRAVKQIKSYVTHLKNKRLVK